MSTIPLPTPYHSGEFAIGASKDVWYAVTEFNNILNIFGGSAYGITQTQFNLGNLAEDNSKEGVYPIDTGKLKDIHNWNEAKIEPFSSGGGCCTSTNEALWLFFNLNIPTMMPPPGMGPVLGAKKYSINSNNPPEWSGNIKLLETDDKTTIPTGFTWASGTRKTASTAIGSNIIFACTATQPGNLPGYIYLGVYDPSKVKDCPAKLSFTKSWAADSMLKISLTDLTFIRLDKDSNTNFKPRSVGFNAEIDWFSTIGSDGKPTYYLTFGFSPVGENKSADTSATFFIPLILGDDGKVSLPTIDKLPSRPLTTFYSKKVPGLSSLRRDAAGRIKYYGYASNKAPISQLYASYINTVKSPSGGSFVNNPDETINLSINWKPEVRPVGLFHTFSSGNISKGDTEDYPVLEFTFGRSVANELRCQLNLYGNIQYDKLTKTLDQKNQQEPTYVISGIIDGPIPIPLQNFKEATTEINSGTLTYGSENAKTKERKTKNAWSVGFESSGKTTLGVGAAWEISFDSGMGKVSGKETKTVTSYEWSIESLFLPKTTEIYPYGALNTVSAQFTINAFRFLDAQGKLISDATSKQNGGSPKLATVISSFINKETFSYKPYAVIPGDLNSYTPNGWNQRMKNLGYSGDNYYGDIICRNAYPLDGAINYLQMSWSGNTREGGGFSQFETTFSENTWSLNSKIYAGVSGGGGINIFGMGEELEMEFLAGATYEHESSNSENKEYQWGLKLGEEWGPPIEPDDPEAIASYAFRIFFLPVPKSPSNLPSNYWAEELRNNMQKDDRVSKEMIDENSGCWKIVYVVTGITYNNGKKLDPPYDKNLEKPSWY